MAWVQLQIVSVRIISVHALSLISQSGKCVWHRWYSDAWTPFRLECLRINDKIVHLQTSYKPSRPALWPKPVWSENWPGLGGGDAQGTCLSQLGLLYCKVNTLMKLDHWLGTVRSARSLSRCTEKRAIVCDLVKNCYTAAHFFSLHRAILGGS